MSTEKGDDKSRIYSHKEILLTLTKNSYKWFVSSSQDFIINMTHLWKSIKSIDAACSHHTQLIFIVIVWEVITWDYFHYDLRVSVIRVA